MVRPTDNPTDREHRRLDTGGEYAYRREGEAHLFTPETVRMPAADFVDMLIRHLSMTELWAGPDFGLGYRRQGDLPFLRQLGAERGFDVRVVDRLMCNGMRVSSSSIRAALSRGDIAWATHCLGRPYRLTGVRDSETPRSDQWDWFFVNVPPERMVPATGVYACLAQVHSHHHAAVVRVDGAPDPADWPTTVRAHVVDLEVTASTDKIALDFIARLSGEHTPMQPTDEVPIGRYIEQARAWIEPHLPQPSRPCG